MFGNSKFISAPAKSFWHWSTQFWFTRRGFRSKLISRHESWLQKKSCHNVFLPKWPTTIRVPVLAQFPWFSGSEEGQWVVYRLLFFTVFIHCFSSSWAGKRAKGDRGTKSCLRSPLAPPPSYLLTLLTDFTILSYNSVFIGRPTLRSFFLTHCRWTHSKC